MPETASACDAGDSACYTIVLAAFDAEATIARAIESVARQTCSAWRLVVVDDGSSDATAAVAAGYASSDARISLLRQPNAGPAAARNAGVAAADTGFVAFLDADDELRDDFIARMDAFINANRGYDIYHPDLRVVTAEGEARFSANDAETATGLSELLTECVIAVGGAVVDRALFERLGGFRSDVHCEDYEFWLRAAAAGARALYLPEPLYVYHQDLEGRRSEDPLPGLRDLVGVLTGMLERGDVPDELVPRTTSVVEERRELIATIEREREMARQAQRVKQGVERTVGPRAAGPVLWVARLGSRLMLPIRRAIATRRVDGPRR